MYMIVHANELSPLKNMYEYIWMQSNILLQSACAYNMSYKTWNSQRCNKTCFRNKKHVSLFVYNMSNITWNFKYSQKNVLHQKTCYHEEKSLKFYIDFQGMRNKCEEEENIVLQYASTESNGSVWALKHMLFPCQQHAVNFP